MQAAGSNQPAEPGRAWGTQPHCDACKAEVAEAVRGALDAELQGLRQSLGDAQVGGRP